MKAICLRISNISPTRSPMVYMNAMRNCYGTDERDYRLLDLGLTI